MISRNYIVAGSVEMIEWLKRHPERRGARLFRLDPEKAKLTRLPESTRFGFIPDSKMAYLVRCDGSVQLWDTSTHKKLDVEIQPSAVWLVSNCDRAI